MNEVTKIAISRWIAVFAILSTFALSKELWIANHNFPLIPAVSGFPVLSDTISNVVFLALSALVFAFGFLPTKYIFALIAVGFALLIQTDINRLQPTYYIFVLVLFAHASKSQRETLLILIFAGIYFWSGIHKYNDYFLEKWLGGMTKRLSFAPEILRKLFTYGVPAIEAGAGLLLLNNRLRKIGVSLLVVMHLLIIFTLMKDQGGFNVIPLNGLMILTLLLVIFPAKTDVFQRFGKSQILIATLVWLLPILNLFGLYDHFLSFSIMSGKPEYGVVYFPSAQSAQKVPESAKPYVHEYEGKTYVQLSEWAGYEKKIMVYPENRVYSSLKDSLTQFLPEPEKSQTELKLYKP